MQSRKKHSNPPPLCHRYDYDSDDSDEDSYSDNLQHVPGVHPQSAHSEDDSDDESNASSIESDYNMDDFDFDSDDQVPALLPRSRPQAKSCAGVMNNIKDMEDLLFLQNSASNLRNYRWDHERLDWDSHVAQLTHEKSFVNEYTMSVPAHGKLVRILDPILERDENKSRCSEPIRVEHIVAAGLRVLSGGRTKDQRHIIGSSRTAAYDAVDDFINAVNSAPELDIKLPLTFFRLRESR